MNNGHIDTCLQPQHQTPLGMGERYLHSALRVARQNRNFANRSNESGCARSEAVVKVGSGQQEIIIISYLPCRRYQRLYTLLANDCQNSVAGMSLRSNGVYRWSYSSCEKGCLCSSINSLVALS